MEKSKPAKEPDQLVNFLEEWREPLFSQDIKHAPKTITTNKKWMPTGEDLKLLAESINDNVQIANRIQ